jgi:hypothetical protein
MWLFLQSVESGEYRGHAMESLAEIHAMASGSGDAD